MKGRILEMYCSTESFVFKPTSDTCGGLRLALSKHYHELSSRHPLGTYYISLLDPRPVLKLSWEITKHLELNFATMPAILLSEEHASNGDSPYNGNSTNGQTGTALNGNGNSTTLKAKIMEPIAICGMACRLPGGISSPDELWELLVSKRDARSRVPADRYNTDGHSSRIPRKPGSTRSDYGYFIDDDLSTFDASCFSMSVAELERCDPQQRLMLMAAYESVADAAEGPLAGRRVGVYMGVSERGWGDLYEKETQNYGSYSMLGTGDFALSNRVSYELDLKGPR